MKKKLTIQDIADMAGVSKAAVSRYMNDGYISKEKAEKIKTILNNLREMSVGGMERIPSAITFKWYLLIGA